MSAQFPADPGKITGGLTLSPAGGAPLEGHGGWMATITEKLAGMRFWTFSVLFHVIPVIFIGGKVLIDHVSEPPDFEGGEGGEFVSQDAAQAPPPQAPPQASQSTPTSATTSATATPVSPAMMSAITSAAPSNVSLQVSVGTTPMAQVSDKAMSSSAVPSPSVNAAGLTKAMAAGIHNFSKGWSKPGGRGMGLKDRSFEFVAYLGKYANGDWDSTVRLDNGKIVEGSLPNLLFVMKRLSRDKVAGEPQAVPLDLASEEIFTKKPPFIFFTGHRDFTLTDKEVANLRNYIIVGGCIWGDSSLAGHRSRFDIAFRREMKRVISDVNKQWKEIPKTHPLFTKCYFPEVKDPPPGINFYREPVYGLEGVGGEIGVIYTANDYGDMFQFGIDEHGTIDTSRDEKLNMVAVNEQMWWRRNLYFRNIEPKSLLASYKFGMNIVIHMMTRWEEKLGMQPR
jgi:hypothetical protein